MGQPVPEEDQYESLPPESSLLSHTLAGALAGIAEHSVMYPIDSIKTRMQMIHSTPQAFYQGTWHALRTVYHQEGLWKLWRGIGSVLLGAGPAHAIYFTAYESAKKHLVREGEEGKSPFATSAAGIIATMTSDAVMNPFDVTKQRMQAHGSHYRHFIECALSLLRTEGLRTFYLSYPTTVPVSYTHLTLPTIA